ncbi:MAG: hypothetical protein OER89_01770 [Gemmatimonadota bacterium]|nr:hypothetical protein [Gemmatimonadota bacterium]
MTRGRATWIAAAVASVVYLLAVRNGWAGDDLVAIRDNPATHSLSSAIAAWFEVYWPGEWRWAGLYRPFTILTYGLDWTIAGGAPWWFHLVNVGLHGAATALVVRVALAWLPPVGALVTGLVFAVHPVHVEAVANVVGRAELLVAVWLLLAVLSARRYRQAESSRTRRWWLAVTLVAVALALCSKEHGVITIAVLAVDHLLEPRRPRNSATGLYVAVAALTLAWLFVWQSIAGGLVGAGTHAAFFGVSPYGRVMTMLPVYLEVLRLLAWPFALASDYAPQVVPVRETVTLVGTLGFLVTGAALALAVLSVRRAPVVAFGILVAVLSYAPTANLLVVSGVVLAERNLYLAVLAPALIVGWGVARVWDGPRRRAVAVACAGVVLLFAYRTVDRIPLWSDPLTLLVEEQAAHPENFHTRVLLGEYVAARGDSAWALGELLVAGALFPADPWAAVLASRQALAQGRPTLALREARRAYRRYRSDARIVEVLTDALIATGRPDSALVVAAAGARDLPGSEMVLAAYRRALVAGAGAAWEATLVDATRDWSAGRVVSAAARLDSLERAPPARAELGAACARLAATVPVVRALQPRLAAVLEVGAACDMPVNGR